MTTEANSIQPTRRSLLGALAAAAAGTAAAAASSAGAQPAPEGRFAGKHVIVTGGNSGIGEAAVRAFAAEGARVSFCARRDNLGRAVEESLREQGFEATWSRVDVREPGAVEAFVDGAVTRYGALDVAFNNAGVGQPFVGVGEVTQANYDEMFATNVAGKYRAMAAEIPHMRAGGSIVNTSSIFGVKSGANAVAYSATMHAVTGMTMGAALEFAPKGVRVNAVAPGAITDTDFMVPIIGRRLNAEEIAQFGGLHALGRTGRAEEVAKAVLFLASQEASFVTGEIFKVDGYFLQG